MDEKTWGGEHWGEGVQNVKSDLAGEDNTKQLRYEIGDIAWGRGLEGPRQLYKKLGIMGHRMVTHCTMSRVICDI